MSSSGSALNLKKYLIPLEEITHATENFSPQRCIGEGGFGRVYKGQLSERWENRTVAIKRLNQTTYQGKNEFRHELEMISKFHHKNIIAFIGYCDEGSEMIIVYEYAVQGSLDHHLEDRNKRRRITWIRRLRICIGVARGLDYLHSGLGDENRVIHRDMKSANILLDDKFVAKVCDFGLSKLGPRNKKNTHVSTKVAGTPYYLDPTYHESGILRKESDVYSFGVVLYEMLSGMLVYRKQIIDNEEMAHSIIHFVRRFHDHKLENLIDLDIKDQVDSRAFEIFKEIAYECITLDILKRPTMATVIEKIEAALNMELEKNVGVLFECFMEEIRFSHGIPVAAFTIYKRLLEKKYLYFEAESTTAFDQLLEIFHSANEIKNDSNIMAYWLSNACTLLFLTKESVKDNPASSVLEYRPPLRMGRGMGEAHLKEYASYKNKAAHTAIHQVRAKKPALDFMQKLGVYVKKVYVIILMNLVKELESIIASCIQEIQTGMLKSRSSYWQDILDLLNTLLNIFKENCVPTIIAQKMFAQIFSYINVRLFNSLIQHHTRCSPEVGKILSGSLLLFNTWCHKATEKYAGSALNELRYIDQAARFLSIPAKRTFTHTLTAYPILSPSQLNALCKKGSYEDNGLPSDNFQDAHALPKREMKEVRSDAREKSVLIKENSSIYFSGNDLSNSLQVEDFTNVEPDDQRLSMYRIFDFLYNQD